jgi:hypothetical protein
MLLQTFSDRDGEKGFDQLITALEARLFHEIVAMVFRHVAESGMHERIGDVVYTGEIKDDRFTFAPHAFDAQRHDTMAHMTIREEVPEFCQHVDFQIHKIKVVSPFDVTVHENNQGF